MVEVNFVNPYPWTQGGWSYGFIFATSDGDVVHSIVVPGIGLWEHRLKTGGAAGKVLLSRPSPNIVTSFPGRNRLRVVNIGEEAWLFINGAFEAKLKLTGLTRPRVIRVCAGFRIPKDLIEGESTRFNALTLWKWHPDLAELP